MNLSMKLMAVIAIVSNVAFCADVPTISNAEIGTKKYPIEVGSFKENYPILKPGGSPVAIIYLNFRQDMPLICAIASFMEKHVNDIDVIAVAGDKANGIVTLLAKSTNKPFVILTSKPTPDMGQHPAKVAYRSITSGDKNLYISPGQIQQLRGKRVALVDDVISTGGTMLALAQLVEQASGRVKKVLVGFTEEAERETLTLTSGTVVPVIKAGHLPVFAVKN